MANKQPTGSEGLYAMGLLRGERGSTKRKKKQHPYATKTPNAKSLEAMQQARTGEGLVGFDSVEEMIADLNDE